MASHEYVRFLLKTPTGFLTPTGTTEDICDKDIIILNIYEVGGFCASTEKEIRSFLNLSTAEVDPSECEVWYHCCDDFIAQYYCENCMMYSYCDLWHDRKKCKFEKHELV